MCAKYYRNWTAFIETIVKWKRVTFFRTTVYKACLRDQYWSNLSLHTVRIRKYLTYTQQLTSSLLSLSRNCERLKFNKTTKNRWNTRNRKKYSPVCEVSVVINCSITDNKMINADKVIHLSLCVCISTVRADL